MPSVQQRRGTRAALDALAGANNVKAGELYLITDEDRVAIGLSASTYQAFQKQGEGEYETLIGDGSTTAITVTHNLGTVKVAVDMYEEAGQRPTRIPDVTRPTANTVTLTFTTAPTTDQYRVFVRAR